MIKTEKKKTGKLNKGPKAIVFMIIMTAYPLVHWVIFYLYANFSSILLAFQMYDISAGKFVMLPLSNIFGNFKEFFNGLFMSSGAPLGVYFLRGALTHLLSVVVCFPISLIFAYVVFKKLPLSGFYKVVLYLPVILSGMIMSLLFKYIMERALPVIFGQPDSFPLLITNPKYAFQTVLSYGVFFGLPGAIILNTSTMSRIPEDLFESGRIEGITMFQEFRHIVLPLMFPLLQIMLLGVFVGFFSATGPQYAIYAEFAPETTVTFGYYMLTRVVGKNASETAYGFTAASNLTIGLISLPIVYGTKRLLDRLNPEAEY